MGFSKNEAGKVSANALIAALVGAKRVRRRWQSSNNASRPVATIISHRSPKTFLLNGAQMISRIVSRPLQPAVKERVDEPLKVVMEVGASVGSILKVGVSDGSSLMVGLSDGSGVGSLVGLRVGGAVVGKGVGRGVGDGVGK